jgi:uncharacterized protein YhaN
MRITRLNLTKYGHLTDWAVDFPAGTPDFHIIVGANEAGKSTTQSAISDFLYGFGHSTPYAFLHQNRDLRIGGQLDGEGGPLVAWRRKASTNSLQDDKGNSVDEAKFSSYLAGIDRETFAQQFSLNHVRLREGGEAILKANSDLGRMLFQAGAGVDWLGTRLDQLEAQCEDLFKPAGNKQLIPQALKRREEALRRKKELVTSDRAYKEARDAEIEATKGLLSQNSMREELAKKRSQLERARRVIPIIRKIDQEHFQLAGIGPVPTTAPDIQQRFDAALRQRTDSHVALETASRELATSQKAFDETIVDLNVLELEQDIDHLLSTLKSRYITAEEDLPKRIAELTLQENVVSSRGREIGRQGLTLEEAGKLIPSKQKVAALRRLSSQYQTLTQALQTAEGSETETTAALDKAKLVIESFGPIPELGLLKQAIEELTSDPGMGTRIAGLEKQIEAQRNDISKRLGRIVPSIPDGIRRLAMPPSSHVDDFVRDLAEVDLHLKNCQDDLQRLTRQQADLKQTCNSLVIDGKAISADDVKTARGHRDLGWTLIQRRYIDGNTPDESAEAEFTTGTTLAESFTKAVANADILTDTRFDSAETSGKLSAKLGDLAHLEETLRELQASCIATEEKRVRLLERWTAAWTESRISPGTPAAMASWLIEVEALEGQAIDLASLEQQLDREKGIEQSHRSRLTAAMASLDAPTLQPDLTTMSILKRAQECLKDLMEIEGRRSAAAHRLEETTAAALRAGETKRNALHSLDQWKTTWVDMLSEWSLAADTVPADVELILEAWAAIQGAYEKVESDQGLRHRVDMMKLDQGRFVEAVGSLVRIIASDLDGQPPLQIAQNLEGRLKSARTQRDIRNLAQKNLTARIETHKKADSDYNRNEELLAAILLELGVTSVADARPLLESLSKSIALMQALSDLRASLSEAGNGLPEEILRAECEGIEFDDLAGQLASLDSQDSLIIAEVQRFGSVLGERRTELQKFLTASAGAAEAAEIAEQAAAEALSGAERYVRLKTTETVLRYAVDRYRKENEGPLLRRASRTFSTLTLSKYSGLEIDYSHQDNPTLYARPAENGSSIPIGGLSDGTRDQLFLALRLAGVEEMIGRGVVLPFIADDLFINFDDERSVAGLRILADLAKRTQVLFFTHHHHIATLAAQHLPAQFKAAQFGALE